MIDLDYDTDLSADADREREHEERIAGLVRKFVSQTDAALAAVGSARDVVLELTSNHVYDVEMAEGAEGRDAVTALDAALMYLRAVKRIAARREDLLDATTAVR